MSIAIRIALIVCSLALFVFVMLSIRKSKLRIEDSLFWFLLSAVVIVMAIFPGLVSECSRLFQFQAPVNFVFLAFIAILLVNSFKMSIRISQLETKLAELTQQLAIRQKESERDARRNQGMELTEKLEPND